MPVLSTLLVSSAFALSVLLQTAAPVNALATPGHAHAARNAVSPNHNGVLRRKRNSHKLRKRCLAQQTVNVNVSASASVDTGDNGGNNNQAAPTGTSNNNNNNYNPPTVSVGAPCSGGKVGLGWGPDLPINYMPNAFSGKVCYYYNWSSWAADGSFTGNLKFAPMYWGDAHDGDFTDNIINSSIDYGVVLGQNEVNQDGQANIDPYTGAGDWNQYVVPLRARGYYLVSPSTTSAPTGIPWMQTWLSQLGPGSKPDALALHWYGDNIGDFINYVNTFSSTFPGYPLWITEFACTNFATGGGCAGAYQDFANQAVNFLDNNPAVQMYAPFGFVGSMSGVAEGNRCMNGDGSLTDVGKIYLGEGTDGNYY